MNNLKSYRPNAIAKSEEMMDGTFEHSHKEYRQTSCRIFGICREGEIIGDIIESVLDGREWHIDEGIK